MLCCSCVYGGICVTHVEMKHKLHMASGSAAPPIQNSEREPAQSPPAPALTVTSLGTQQSRVLSDINLCFVYCPCIAALPAILRDAARMRGRWAGLSNQRARWVVSGRQWGGAMQPSKSFLIRDLLGDVLTGVCVCLCVVTPCSLV